MATEISLPLTGDDDVADLAFSVDLDTSAHLRLRGELDGETAALLACVVDCQISRGNRDVCLDLGALSFVDVRGFAAIVAVRDRLRERGGRLRVVGAGWLVRSIADWWGVPDLLDDATDEPIGPGALPAPRATLE